MPNTYEYDNKNHLANTGTLVISYTCNFGKVFSPEYRLISCKKIGSAVTSTRSSNHVEGIGEFPKDDCTV